MLLNQTGKSLIQHTYENACLAKKPSRVVLAVDDVSVAAEAAKFGAPFVMTSPGHQSGTDRIAAASENLIDADIIVNVQGDEPELPPAAIDKVVQLLEDNPSAPMSTLATPIRDRQTLNDPARVKVVFDTSGRAIYFSRSPIPHARDWDEGMLTSEPAVFHLHLGIYAYRRPFLQQFAKMTPSRLEQLEKLEQLRVLSAGLAIQVGVIQHSAGGIDTLEDYEAFVRRQGIALRLAG